MLGELSGFGNAVGKDCGLVRISHKISTAATHITASQPLDLSVDFDVC